jgi:hypothetical protein
MKRAGRRRRITHRHRNQLAVIGEETRPEMLVLVRGQRVSLSGGEIEQPDLLRG